MRPSLIYLLTLCFAAISNLVFGQIYAEPVYYNESGDVLVKRVDSKQDLLKQKENALQENIVREASSSTLEETNNQTTFTSKPELLKNSGLSANLEQEQLPVTVPSTVELPNQASSAAAAQEVALRKLVEKTETTVQNFGESWQQAWQDRDSRDMPSTMFSALAERFKLGEISSDLTFRSFDVAKIENGIEKKLTLNAQYSALKNLDVVLGDIADQLIAEYGKFRKSPDMGAIADAASTIAVITNMRSNILDEQQKIYDGITSLDTWQQSSFKALLQGVVLNKESFSSQQLPKTLKLVEALAENITKMEKEILHSDNEKMLTIDSEAFSDWLTDIEELEKELPDIESLKEARLALANLVKVSNDTWSTLEAQRILVSTRTFTSRVNDFSAYLRKLIGAFFNAALGNSPLSRVIQFKNVSAGDNTPDAQAAVELFRSGASQPRRQQVYTELRERIAQVNNSIKFATEFVESLTVVPADKLSIEQKRVLTELRSTLINHLDGIKKFGDMLGVQIKSPSDSFGTTMINLVKQFYEPAQKNIWLLPLITGNALAAADTIKLLDSQSSNASRLLNKLNNQIFKQTSFASQALYTTSLISDVIAQVGGTIGIGGLVTAGAFVKFAGANLPFMNLTYLVPVFLVAGGALAYMISYATYQAALGLSGLES